MDINIKSRERKALRYQAKADNLELQIRELSLEKYWERKRYFKKSKRKEHALQKAILNREFVKHCEDESFIANAKKTRNKKAQIISLRTILYTLLIAYALITLYPFVWSIFGSFRSQSEFANAGLNPLPKNWNTDAYKYLFTNPNSHFTSWIMNSFLICIAGVALNIFLNTVAGYSLARIKFKGRGMILWVFLALTMIPGQVLLIPNYLLIKNFSLLNNLLGLIIPSAVNIGFIFMSRQFFLNLSKDVEEASVIDGMSKFRLITRVVFPLMRPLIITQVIFLFMSFWNSFIQAQLYINDPQKYPLTLGIQKLVETDSYKIQYPQILAASTFSMIPALAMYIGLNGIILKGQRGDGDK